MGAGDYDLCHWWWQSEPGGLLVRNGGQPPSLRLGGCSCRRRRVAQIGIELAVGEPVSDAVSAAEERGWPPGVAPGGCAYQAIVLTRSVRVAALISVISG
jgi:hypothetical protein